MLGRFSRILVADGCSFARKITHGALLQLRYDNIECVSDGRAALRLLSQHPYRLVFADWDLASLNGLDLLKAMRADLRSRRTPFIMAIAPSQKKFIEIARDDGMTLYITKPFVVETLAERIAQLIAAPSIKTSPTKPYPNPAFFADEGQDMAGISMPAAPWRSSPRAS